MQVDSVEDDVQLCLRKIKELQLDDVSDKDKADFKKRKLISEV